MNLSWSTDLDREILPWDIVELLKNNKDYRIANENFVILSDNYKTIQIHKNIEDYRRQNLTPKP